MDILTRNRIWSYIRSTEIDTLLTENVKLNNKDFINISVNYGEEVILYSQIGGAITNLHRLYYFLTKIVPPIPFNSLYSKSMFLQRKRGVFC